MLLTCDISRASYFRWLCKFVLSQCCIFVVLSCLLCLFSFVQLYKLPPVSHTHFMELHTDDVISRGVKCVSVISCIDLTMTVQCISYGISQSIILWYVIPSFFYTFLYYLKFIYWLFSFHQIQIPPLLTYFWFYFITFVWFNNCVLYQNIWIVLEYCCET